MLNEQYQERVRAILTEDENIVSVIAQIITEITWVASELADCLSNGKVEVGELNHVLASFPHAILYLMAGGMALGLDNLNAKMLTELELIEDEIDGVNITDATEEGE